MSCFFFFNDTATTEIYTLSLHDALPISSRAPRRSAPARASLRSPPARAAPIERRARRSEEHTSELQSRRDLVCRLLLEKKKQNRQIPHPLTKKPNLIFSDNLIPHINT